MARLSPGRGPDASTQDAGAVEDLHLSDAVLELPEQDAVALSLDALNARRLRNGLWGLVVVMTVYALIMYAEGTYIRGALANLVVVANLGVLRALGGIAERATIRQTVAAVLVGHLAVVSVIHFMNADAVGAWFAALLLLALRFRMLAGEAAALVGSLYAVLVLRLIGGSMLERAPRPPVTALIAWAIVAVVAFTIIWLLSRQRIVRFRTRWLSESERHRDRLRMKRELEYAREIQLSMLPREAPDLDWLDLAALSLPATEVGGDYYDYFSLGNGRLVVVVGDVTGHGVASGLVLSGVRSCLNLLQDELANPDEVLGRVNRMLKRTATPRMLMTLGVVVLDRTAGTATVATAGHPPVLVRRASGAVVEVGRGAVPLGALRSATYRSDVVPIEDGDVVFVYSDGVVETENPAGVQFGWERLRAALGGDPDHASAREVRDTVLREVWDFKGPTEQVDDVTMVVARWRG